MNKHSDFYDAWHLVLSHFFCFNVQRLVRNYIEGILNAYYWIRPSGPATAMLIERQGEVFFAETGSHFLAVPVKGDRNGDHGHGNKRK